MHFTKDHVKFAFSFTSLCISAQFGFLTTISLCKLWLSKSCFGFAKFPAVIIIIRRIIIIVIYLFIWHLLTTDYVIPKALYNKHYYYPSSSQALWHSWMRGSHLLPSQLPGEHPGHKATSRHGKPFWNAHYSSTHCYCWYSFYLPTGRWRVESTPSQVEYSTTFFEQPTNLSMKNGCKGNWMLKSGLMTNARKHPIFIEKFT